MLVGCESKEIGVLSVWQGQDYSVGRCEPAFYDISLNHLIEPLSQSPSLVYYGAISFL